jgi:hypothetical protein
VSPQGGEQVKGHPFERGPGSPRFYMLEAFSTGVIDALNTTADQQQKDQAGKALDARLATLHVQYLKALRADRGLIHLGDAKR